MKLLITTTAATALMASLAVAQADDNARYDAATPETTLNDTGKSLDDNARYEATTAGETLKGDAKPLDDNAQYDASTQTTAEGTSEDMGSTQVGEDTALGGEVNDNARYEAVTPDETLNENGEKLDDNARYDAATSKETLNDDIAPQPGNEKYISETEPKQ